VAGVDGFWFELLLPQTGRPPSPAMTARGCVCRSIWVWPGDRGGDGGGGIGFVGGRNWPMQSQFG